MGNLNLKVFNYSLSPRIGGTEIMKMKLQKHIIPKIDNLQKINWIICPGHFENNGIESIAWLHLRHYDDRFYWLNEDNIKHIVFVSQYQYEMFKKEYDLDPEKCSVIQNFIKPVKVKKKTLDKIDIVYHSEIYRGLDLLIKAIDNSKYKDIINLNVYADLFPKKHEWQNEHIKLIKQMSKEREYVTLNKYMSHKDVLKEIGRMNMFVLPGTVDETSCLSLIEAMSAGCYCITSDKYALKETGLGFSKTYEFTENELEHINLLTEQINLGVEEILKGFDYTNQKKFVDKFYGKNRAMSSWENIANTIQLSVDTNV
jgi:glycosyltransferase involved in cell wall biosynthesis